MHEFSTGVLPALVAVGGCAALILGQPDFGTAAIVGVLLLLMLYVGGARPAHLLALLLCGALAMTLAVQLAPYRMRRLLAFRDPWAHSQDTGGRSCER